MAAWAETDVGEITATLMHLTTLAARTLAQLTSGSDLCRRVAPKNRR